MSNHDDDKPMTTAELNAFIAESVRLVEAEREHDPDPRIAMERRIMSGSGWRPDLSTYAGIAQWDARQAERERQAQLRLEMAGRDILDDNLVVEGQVAG